MPVNMILGGGGLGAGQAIVATAGVPVQLDPVTDGSQLWRAVLIKAKAANTGAIVVGDSTLSATNWPNDGLTSDQAIWWDPPSGGGLDLSLIYIDAAVSGEGVDFWPGK